MLFYGACVDGESIYKPVIKFESNSLEEAQKYYCELQKQSDYSFSCLVKYKGYKRNGILCIQEIL